MKESHMILLRDITWPQDRAPLLALDTSFTSDRVYQLQQAGHSFTLEAVVASQPVYKCYPLASEVETLASLDWVQVASDGREVVGVVGMGLQPWNRRANLRHLYLGRAVRRRGIGRAMVEAAVDEARKRGARSLWVETQTINYGAIRFYERMGFEWCGLDTSLCDSAEVQEGEVAVFFSRAVA
jgi:ribosomal protein S18 acetylase RimI-like enzyme